MFRAFCFQASNYETDYLYKDQARAIEKYFQNEGFLVKWSRTDSYSSQQKYFIYWDNV